jgi:hypothetical protein
MTRVRLIGRTCAALLVIGVAAQAWTAERPVVAVFDVEPQGVELDPVVLDRLNNYLCSLLAERGYQVVPRSQLKARLAEQKVDSYRLCFDESCQIEIGKELAAQKSLATQLIRLGGSCKATLTLFDLRTTASERGATVSGGCGEDGVVQALEEAVGKLIAGERLAVKPLASLGEPAVKPAEEDEVRQPGRNLYWLRCPVGQKWSGSRCEGVPVRVFRENAMSGCPEGYRLPTLAELFGLLGGCDVAIDDNNKAGKCNPCAASPFCASTFVQGGGHTWSATSYTFLLGEFYRYVELSSGEVNSVGSRVPAEVRCVRSVLDPE